MTEIESLVEKLKAGSGPDRAIDRDVAAAVGYAVNVIKVPAGHPIFKEGGGLEFMSKDGGPNVGIPPWTLSLDACIGLMKEVLPRWSWEVRKSGYGLAQSTVWNPTQSPQVDIRIDHQDGDPCRAFLIAILTAHEQMGEVE